MDRLRITANSGLDFTQHMRQVCDDIVARLPQFSHVRLSEVLICFCQARNRTYYGMHASLTPLRFQGGARETIRRGRRYTIQRVTNAAGQEMLYLLSFYLPRFHDTSFEEKITTIVHELWHIGPEFNGDVRRHPGRCYAHSSSKEKYDGAMRDLARTYLATQPAEHLLAPLRLSFDELRQRGGIYGLKVPRPRLIPVTNWPAKTA